MAARTEKLRVNEDCSCRLSSHMTCRFVIRVLCRGSMQTMLASSKKKSTPLHVGSGISEHSVLSMLIHNAVHVVIIKDKYGTIQYSNILSRTTAREWHSHRGILRVQSIIRNVTPLSNADKPNGERRRGRGLGGSSQGPAIRQIRLITVQASRMGSRVWTTIHFQNGRGQR
jgi:hypothetical protein